VGEVKSDPNPTPTRLQGTTLLETPQPFLLCNGRRSVGYAREQIAVETMSLRMLIWGFCALLFITLILWVGVAFERNKIAALRQRLRELLTTCAWAYPLAFVLWRCAAVTPGTAIIVVLALAFVVALVTGVRQVKNKEDYR
jgi:anaerobic C4-dicarboxylate transporter